MTEQDLSIENHASGQMRHQSERHSEPNCLGHISRRKNKRTDVPTINIEFSGVRYQTNDWGLGGFKIDNCQEPIQKDEEFLLDSIWLDGEVAVPNMRLLCRGIRRNGHELSCTFLELNSEAFDFLEAKILHRNRRAKPLLIVSD